MPNHITHKLTITGQPTALDDFQSQCIGEKDDHVELNFNALTPMPDILKETTKGNTDETKTQKYKDLAKKALDQTGFSNWYDWRIAQWGTKWDAYHCYLTRSSTTEIALTFDTAWSIPEPIFEKLGENFPTLKFHGFAIDEGFSFGAEISIIEGESSIRYFDIESQFVDAFYEMFGG